MTLPNHDAELEYERLRQWLLAPDSDVDFVDPANRRLVDVVRALKTGAATPLEFAVLLRQHAQRWASMSRRESDDPGWPTADRPTQPLKIRGLRRWLTRDALETAGIVVTADGDSDLVLANAWEPKWLENPARIAVDDSYNAGTVRGWRERPGAVDADPAFLLATGYKRYKTHGQRAAVRMALEMHPRGLMIANLPTGSGKTEIAVTLAHSFGTDGGGTLVMVVPTIALAQDLEARFRSQWQRTLKRDMSSVPFAWTSETGDEQRDQLQERVVTGRQPIIVTSPESLLGKLLETMRSAASSGRLRGLVVDEAHLITQWGRSFRPEFRLLGGLWRELKSMSGLGVRAVLLSATMTSDVVEDLHDVFRSADGPSIVAANALRPEPRFWVAVSSPPNERKERVLDAIAHLPRPCVLYVTSPHEAKRWVATLRLSGYQRVVEVTGESWAAERRAALTGIRTGPLGSAFDVVVGTSAFGLGIDVDEIRTVLHACMPETADRWYQELGRAGRDGYASTAVLIPADCDRSEALGLGVNVLTVDVALARWNAMWNGRRDEHLASDGGTSYVNLRCAPTGKSDGSYNRRWNSQILDGLAELGVLSRQTLSWDDARRLGLVEQQPDRQRLPDSWHAVKLLRSPPDRAFFDGEWTQWKERVERLSWKAVDAVEGFIATRDACGTVEAAYSPSLTLTAKFGSEPAQGFGITRPCGRCQACNRMGFDDRLDPAPDPSVRWAGEILPTAFDNMVNDIVFGSGTRFAGRLDRVAVFEGAMPDPDQFVCLLVSAGVRLGAGPQFLAERKRFRYFDEVPDPMAMLPIPALVGCADPASLSGLLELMTLRPPRGDGRGGPVLVHVSEVPRDLRAQRPLAARDVLSLLESRQ